MVLPDHVAQVLHAPQLAVLRHNSPCLCGAECLRISRVLIDRDGERQAAVLSPHHLLEKCSAAETSRFALSINSRVRPSLSTARYRYLH